MQRAVAVMQPLHDLGVLGFVQRPCSCVGKHTDKQHPRKDIQHDLPCCCAELLADGNLSLSALNSFQRHTEGGNKHHQHRNQQKFDDGIVTQNIRNRRDILV